MKNKVKLRYRVGSSPQTFLKLIDRGITVQQLMDVVAGAGGEPFTDVSVDGAILSPADDFDDHYESVDQMFVFSRNERVRLSDWPREIAVVKGAVRHGQKEVSDLQREQMEQRELLSRVLGQQERLSAPQAVLSTLEERVVQIEGKCDAAVRENRRLSLINDELTRKVARLEDRLAKLESMQQLVLPDAPERRMFDPVKPLEGIIAHLTQKCGGNVHKNGIVVVTASSAFRLADRAVQFTHSSWFQSENLRNQWICYDFRKMTIIPSHYTVQTANYSRNWDHLKNWVVEGSNNVGSWTELDRRVDNGDLNEPGAIRTFAVARTAEVHMIRLRQTGPNHRNRNDLVILALEIFGSLMEGSD
jgi:hypothetical protein